MILSLVPRGGGAFLNEIDGNFRLWRDGSTAQLTSDPAKFRGAPVEISFAIEQIRSEAVKDTKGRLISTPVFVVVSEEEHAVIQKKEWQDENLLLSAMRENPKGSQSDWAIGCGWFADSEPKHPRKDRVNRLLQELKREKPPLVKQARSGRWSLTDTGQKEAMKP